MEDGTVGGLMELKLNKEFDFYPYSDLVTVDDMKFDFSIKDSDFINNY